MNSVRHCFSCEKPVNWSFSFPVRGVKNALFCGDHFQLGKAFVCTPCAGQLTKMGTGPRLAAPATN